MNESNTIEVKKIEIPKEKLPLAIAGQFKKLTELKVKIDEANELANVAKEKAETAYNQSASFGNKKAAIESLQDAVLNIGNAEFASTEAQQKLFEYQKEITNITENLFKLGVANITANRIVVREIKMQLENASQEELDELAIQELEKVLSQLKAQEDMMNKQEEHNEKIRKLHANDEIQNEKLQEHDEDIEENREDIEDLQEINKKQAELLQEHNEDIAENREDIEELQEKNKMQGEILQEHYEDIAENREDIEENREDIEELEKNLKSLIEHLEKEIADVKATDKNLKNKVTVSTIIAGLSLATAIISIILPFIN